MEGATVAGCKRYGWARFLNVPVWDDMTCLFEGQRFPAVLPGRL